MKLRISMQNQGSELDARTVEGNSAEVAGQRAANVLLSMVQQSGVLRHGDVFTVEEVRD